MHGLNQGEITVFASQLHTHLTGRRVWTSQVRDGRVIEILNRDNHYDQMFQEIRMLKEPVRVRPGDTLINTCVYETMARKNMTVGGYAISDEMCVNYLHYYPLSRLEVCKSSLSDNVLENYFEKMKRIDLADTSSQKSIRQNFDSIRWTELTGSILNRLYDLAPINLSCNSSDGKRIEEAYELALEKTNSVFRLNQIKGLKTDFAPIDFDLINDCKGYIDWVK